MNNQVSVFVHKIAVLGLVSCLGSGVGRAQESLSLSLEIPKTKISLHEPVMAIFSIHNQLTEGADVDLGFDRTASLHFTITRPDGLKVTRQRPDSAGFGRIGKIHIAAGETYKQRIVINEWFEFAMPGIYSVELGLSDRVRNGLSEKSTVKPSPKVIVNIGPRNSDELDQVCQKLTKLASESWSVEESRQAAVALSFVSDAVAIPYLAKVLADGPFGKSYAIDGLTRIADSSAAETLIDALKNQDPEVQSLIRRALRRIEAQTNDPDLKRRIEDVAPL